MYRVVIVDDEPWAFIGIRKLLESSGNRFKVICETTEPVEALEVICEERPEVVFTDIRMPEISGIELMRMTREKGIETDFIVVSGFADFSYVQHALQEGALDYQLKPLDLEMAGEMIEKLYKKLENKRSAADLMAYVSLLEESGDNRALLKKRMNRTLYPRYQVVTVYFENSEYDDAALFDLGNNAQFTALKLGPKKCAYIMNSDEEISEWIYSRLTAKENLLDRAGISLSGKDANQLSMLLKTSDMSSHDCFVNPAKKISQYSKSKISYVKQFAEQIVEALARDQYKNLKEITSGMTAFYIANHMGIEDAVLLWNEIVMNTLGNSENEGKFTDFELLDYIEIKEKFMDLEALSEYLFEQLSYLERDQPGDAHSKFKELLLYTHKHYQEELFLKELSNRFFINISYCCELFKKVTGMTFSQYMTDLRMKKACELLQNSALSIAEICTSVGYSDYFYFNKVFKRYSGCTPSKYRKAANKESEDFSGEELNALD